MKKGNSERIKRELDEHEYARVRRNESTLPGKAYAQRVSGLKGERIFVRGVEVISMRKTSWRIIFFNGKPVQDDPTVDPLAGLVEFSEKEAVQKEFINREPVGPYHSCAGVNFPCFSEDDIYIEILDTKKSDAILAHAHPFVEVRIKYVPLRA